MSDERVPLLGDLENQNQTAVVGGQRLLQQGDEANCQNSSAHGDSQDHSVSPGAIITSISTIPRHSGKYIIFSWTNLNENRYIAMLSCLFITLILPIILLLLFKTATIFDQTVKLVYISSEVNNVTEKGMSLGLQGSISFNYSSMNRIYKLFYYPTTILLRTVAVSFPNDIELFVTFPSIGDMEYYNPVNLNIPDLLLLELSPDSVNSLELTMEIYVNSSDAVRAYHDYLILKECNTEHIEIKLLLKTEINFYKGMLSAKHSTAIERTITYEIDSFDPSSIILTSLSANQTENTIKSELEIKIQPLPIPISLNLTQIDWELFLFDCEHNFIYVGSFFTENISISKYEPVNISCKTLIPKFHKKLLTTCDDGFSPINHFINMALHSRPSLFLKAKSVSEANRKLPQWLYIFLSNNYHPLNISLDKIVDDESTLNYEIHDGKVTIINDENVLPRADLAVGISIDLPSENHGLFEIDNILGDLCFFYEGEAFVKIYLTDWQHVETNNCRFDIDINGARIDIINDLIFADLVQKSIDGTDFDFEGLAVLDLNIKSPVFDTILKEMVHDFNINMKGSKDLLDTIRICLQSLEYISASRDTELKTFITTEVSNPFHLGAAIQFLSLNLLSNDTVVGTIDIADTAIFPLDESAFVSILRLDTGNQTSKVVLERVLSDYISNKTSVLTVSGNPKSSKVTKLSKVLERLLVPINVPSFENPAGDSNGFLVGCTFYIFKSEVDITVYNPFENQDVRVAIKMTRVIHEGIDIAYIEDAPILTLPPGISTSQRIPVLYPRDIVKKILKKAINGNLKVSVVADFELVIDQFSVDLTYEGSGLQAEIKL